MDRCCGLHAKGGSLRVTFLSPFSRKDTSHQNQRSRFLIIGVYGSWCSSNAKNVLLFGGVMQQMVVVAAAQESEKLSQMRLTLLTAIPRSLGTVDRCVLLLRLGLLVEQSAERTTPGGGGLPPEPLKIPARSPRMQGPAAESST